jgi:phosphoglycerate dehydrogenase-like enzyme
VKGLSGVKILVSNEIDDQVGRDLLGRIEGVEVLAYDPNSSQLTGEQRAANVLIPPYRGSHRPIRLLGQLPDLRMVQLLSAGADEWAGDVPANVTLASARGAHAGPVSEWVLAAILALLRQWPALVRYQDTGTWAHRKADADTLAGKRVLIVGAGSIGTARLDVHAATELPGSPRRHSWPAPPASMSTRPPSFRAWWTGTTSW